jgi:hypothetical protein
VTREFIDHSVSTMGDAELLAALVDKERARRQLYAEELAVLAELDGRGVAGPLGYSDVAAIARELLRMNPAAARQQVAHARAVAGGTTPTGARLAPDLPRVAEAAADGTIGPEHVEAIRATEPGAVVSPPPQAHPPYGMGSPDEPRNPGVHPTLTHRFSPSATPQSYSPTTHSESRVIFRGANPNRQ